MGDDLHSIVEAAGLESPTSVLVTLDLKLGVSTVASLVKILSDPESAKLMPAQWALRLRSTLEKEQNLPSNTQAIAFPPSTICAQDDVGGTELFSGEQFDNNCTKTQRSYWMEDSRYGILSGCLCSHTLAPASPPPCHTATPPQCRSTTTVNKTIIAIPINFPIISLVRHYPHHHTNARPTLRTGITP